MPCFNFKVHWRTIQISINICSMVTGFCAFLPLGYVTKMFSNHCVLYGNTRITGIVDNVVQVNNEMSVWGSTDTCQFTIFTTVISSIHAFFWCWFFLCMKAQLKMERAEFPMLLASFLLHGLVMVVMIISSSVLSAGVNTWCGNLAKQLDEKNSGQINSCIEAQDLTWDLIGEQYSFYKYLLVSKISSWICVVTIICQFLVCGYKLYVWALQTNGEHKRNPNLLPNSNGIHNGIGNSYQHIDDKSDNDSVDKLVSTRSNKNQISSGYRKLVVSSETPSMTPPPEMV